VPVIDGSAAHVVPLDLPKRSGARDVRGNHPRKAR
jgi:hypothetical protein